MSLYDLHELEEAMNAIKDEMMEDRFESLVQEKISSDYIQEKLEIN